MAAHTPGPWRYSPEPLPWIWSETEIEQGSRLEKDRVRIADVRGWGGLQYRADGAEMQDANGRLLAAAPELLEAGLAALDALIWDEFRGNGASRSEEVRGLIASVAHAQGKNLRRVRIEAYERVGVRLEDVEWSWFAHELSAGGGQS